MNLSTIDIAMALLLTAAWVPYVLYQLSLTVRIRQGRLTDRIMSAVEAVSMPGWVQMIVVVASIVTGLLFASRGLTATGSAAIAGPMVALVVNNVLTSVYKARRCAF